MITCCLTYRIDPFKTVEFEQYARRWIPLVARFGGVHHGYYLPCEGANDVAMALFSFSNLVGTNYTERLRRWIPIALRQGTSRGTRDASSAMTEPSYGQFVRCTRKCVRKAGLCARNI